MTVQEIIVAAIVLFSVVFLFVRAMKAMRTDGSCSTGCGCGPSRRNDSDRLGKRIDLIQLNTDAKPRGKDSPTNNH